MYRKYLLVVSLLALSCSSKQVVISENPSGQKPSANVDSSVNARDSIHQQGSAAAHKANHQNKDTSHVSIDSTKSNLSESLSDSTTTIDSTSDDSEFMLPRLEQARQHYLMALHAQEIGDSLQSGVEFENAIQILNELSDFPGLDTNQEFIDLSSSIVEDYEKYIAVIDTLSPYASLFAFREKMSQEEEKVDTTKIVVPKLEIKGTQVPLPTNEYVERAEKFFMDRGRHYMERWLSLGGKYVPMMQRIFREEGTPEELVYLSMMESGLRTDAKSWARAVGIWQFMKGTGALYGLRSNWWYDERRDFEKETRAAARHLKELYSELNDWNLVLASYNAGAGRVFRAIRRSGSTDFWTMRKYLPRQTRGYIPQYIAVTRMAMDPKSYGFEEMNRADSLMYDVVEVNDCVDLRVLAKCALTTVDTIQSLNPELLRWCTPPGVVGYRLRIPAGRADTFRVQYPLVPKEQKKDWVIHTVRRRETLSSIARQYSMSVSLIKDVNNLRSTRRLSVGTQLAIPIPKDIADEKVPFNYTPQVRGLNFSGSKAIADAKDYASRHHYSSRHEESRPPKGREKVVYHVKRGDTIGHIAEWYGIRASDIRNWNDIAYGSYIRPGEALAIWVPAAKLKWAKTIDAMDFQGKQAMSKGEAVETAQSVAQKSSTKASSSDWIQHEVKSGESLDKIARIYEVSIADLKRWNDLRRSRIKTGQILEIYDRPEEKNKIIPVAPVLGAKSSIGVKTSSSGIFSATHKVKKGESIFLIALQYGVNIKSIKKVNHLRSNRIRIGQVLKIPAKSES